jgi:hypothetical protein
MIDLTKKMFDYYELIWFDGEKLEIKRPSQSMLIDMLALVNLPEEKQVEGMYELVREVLNNNTSNRVFTEEEINSIDFSIIELIVEDYLQTVFPNLGQ